MRIGLIAVGAAFAIVGAGVIVAITAGSPSTTVTRTGDASVNQLAPSSAEPMFLRAVPTSSGAAEIRWNATAPAQVWWYTTVPCGPPAGWCFEGGLLLHNWSNSSNGEWSWQGAVGSVYCLYVKDISGPAVNVTASFQESYRALVPALTMVPFIWTMVGGSLLAGVGGIGLYLGAFLPSGVYSSLPGAPGDPVGDEADGEFNYRLSPPP